MTYARVSNRITGGIGMNEKHRDLELHIKTTDLGEQQVQSPHYHHYEATAYWMLDELFKHYQLEQSDGFVDYGCGKGRVLYYVHHRFKVSVTGVEMNLNHYQDALANKETYLKNIKRRNGLIHIECCLAEDYQIKSTENCFFFFNPFSLQIFITIVNQILMAVEKNKRTVDIILYYPAMEYVDYLETRTPFELFQDITVPRIIEINARERFLIYRFQ